MKKKKQSNHFSNKPYRLLKLCDDKNMFIEEIEKP